MSRSMKDSEHVLAQSGPEFYSYSQVTLDNIKFSFFVALHRVAYPSSIAPARVFFTLVCLSPKLETYSLTNQNFM